MVLLCRKAVATSRCQVRLYLIIGLWANINRNWNRSGVRSQQISNISDIIWTSSAFRGPISPFIFMQSFLSRTYFSWLKMAFHAQWWALPQHLRNYSLHTFPCSVNSYHMRNKSQRWTSLSFKAFIVPEISSVFMQSFLIRKSFQNLKYPHSQKQSLPSAPYVAVLTQFHLFCNVMDNSPAAHGGRSLPMGWTYFSKCMYIHMDQKSCP